MAKRLMYLERFTRGWTVGDADAIVQSLADDFVFENPNMGRISRSDFKQYFEKLKEQMRHFGYSDDQDFMQLSNQMTFDDGQTLVFWTWYRITSTPVEGASLIKIADAGVRSDWLTFHAPPKL